MCDACVMMLDHNIHFNFLCLQLFLFFFPPCLKFKRNGYKGFTISKASHGPGKRTSSACLQQYEHAHKVVVIAFCSFVLDCLPYPISHESGWWTEEEINIIAGSRNTFKLLLTCFLFLLYHGLYGDVIARDDSTMDFFVQRFLSGTMYPTNC